MTDCLRQMLGVAVRSHDLGGNIIAGLRTIISSEIKEYTSPVRDTRRQAIGRLVIANTIGNLVADRISRGGVSKNGSDDPAKSGDAVNAKGGTTTTGAGDGTATQPTVGEGGGQIGGGVSSANTGGGLAGPDYLNPQERAPTSVEQLDSDEANLEAANNAYRSANNGLNLADY